MYDDVGRVLANEAAAREVARRVDTDEVSRRDAIMMVSVLFNFMDGLVVLDGHYCIDIQDDATFLAKIFSVRKVYLGSPSFQRMRWVGGSLSIVSQGLILFAVVVRA